MTTKISWTARQNPDGSVTPGMTVNPFPGCRKVSPGCRHCYAEKMAWRLKAMGHPAYQDVVDKNGWTGMVGDNLMAMKIPGKGKVIFANSMGDLFYEGVSDKQRAAAISMIYLQPDHVFQILTKRPEAALRYWQALRDGDAGLGNSLRMLGIDSMWARLCLAAGMMTNKSGVPPYKLPKNLWLGVTVESPDYLNRIATLLQIPAAVRFVSLEPLLLGPVDVSPYLEHFTHPHDGLRHSKAGVGPWKNAWLDWIIVGCETGPGHRPCKLEWVEAIVAQGRAAGVPCHVKALEINGKLDHDIDKFPPHLRVREYPRKAGDV